MNNTDSLAAKIMRAKGRGDAGTFSNEGRAARQHRIDGMCDAWEHLTGETATEENLTAAAAKAGA